MIFTDRGITGFDISTWQDSPAISGNVDFRKMRDYGAQFVIVKAGQGDWIDPDFLTNWHNSKGLLPRASYWYYDNRYDPKAQARKYYDIIKFDMEGICWLDLEDKTAGTFAGWRKWFDFLEEFKLLSGPPLIINTSGSGTTGAATGSQYSGPALHHDGTGGTTTSPLTRTICAICTHDPTGAAVVSTLSPA